MMPPDTSPLPQEPLRGNQKDSKTTSPYPSRVRNLLGLPNIDAVPLLSTMSLPIVDLPYITSQMGIASSAPKLWGGSQWAEFKLDTRGDHDSGDVELLLSDSSQHLRPSELTQKTSNGIPGVTPPRHSNSLSSSLSNDSSLEKEGNLTEPPTRSEFKTTVSSEEPLSTVLGGSSTAENHYLANLSSEKATETEIEVEGKGERTEGSKLTPVDEDSENPGSVLRSIPQKTSIIIPGLTPPSSSLEKERNLTEPSTKSELKTTVSSEEPLLNDLAGSSTAENHYLANPSSEKATETEIKVEGKGERTEGSKLTPVDEDSENPGSVLRSTPQKTSIIIPGLTPPRPSNSLSSSLSSDSSLEKERNLTNPPTKSEFKTTVSSEEPLLNDLAGNSTAENHYLANPSSEKATETEIKVEGKSEPTEGSGRQTVLNLSNSQSKVKSRPQAESTSPVITPQTKFIPESMTKKPMSSLPLPLSETLPRSEVARSDYQKANSMVAQIKKLERTVADLSAQVAAQKDFQQPVIPQYPQPSQPQVIVQRSASQSKAPQAFWERSYVNRLYRWLRR